MAYLIRQAQEADLPALAAYEITIAKTSFGEDAIIDSAVHIKKLSKALDRDQEGMLVAEDETGNVVGWLWIAINTNFLTEERYANFRSLAVSPGCGEAGEALLERALNYARDCEVTEVLGRVHVTNQEMRVLYRKYDFEPVHLVLRHVFERPSP